ncbi:MAG: hypothetical protein P794_02070 [Epsilonproteobacteria bacterium (ex Lamellibrachia satsuma)]|nr:MAG: hypothetical protein P794_02070 [Epsilonproteobacteria bacterium (ex Lamellibrachia satsuma)]
MSTYNGDKYLKNQILSLQQQTHKKWRLLIRDDGSTDRTTEIITYFCQNDERIERVEDDLGNLGVAKSFFQLLQCSTADYVIFCDQDDIWLEKKLEFLLKAAKEHLGTEVPSLVYCDGYAYSNENGTILSNSISHLHADNLQEFLFFNSGYQGCSILFNKKLATMAKQYDKEFYMHDDIVSLIGHTFGKVYFLAVPLMLYRQHECNVTGKAQLKKWDALYRFFRRDAFVLSKEHYAEKKEFFSCYRQQMAQKERVLFEAYLQFPTLPLFKRFVLIFHHGFSLGGMKLPLWIKTLIRRPIG